MANLISQDYIKNTDTFTKLDFEEVQAELFRNQLQQAYQEGYNRGFEDGRSIGIRR